MSTTHIFNVEMACEGCCDAVERVLNNYKEKGVDDFTISITKQRVMVTSALPAEQLLDIIQRSNKKASYVGIQTRGKLC